MYVFYWLAIHLKLVLYLLISEKRLNAFPYSTDTFQFQTELTKSIEDNMLVDLTRKYRFFKVFFLSVEHDQK